MAPKHTLQNTGLDCETSAKRRTRSTTNASDVEEVYFTIEYPAKSSNRKLSKEKQQLINHAELQVSPFVTKGNEGDLDQFFTVVPIQAWASMKTYANFIMRGKLYTKKDFVYVKGEGASPEHEEEHEHESPWVARMLQIKAKDPQHVYALVAWMFWKHQLPHKELKQASLPDPKMATYHGNNELIASNYMDVLDVLSIEGKAEVNHWLEESDEEHRPSGLYWRQTLNRKTKQLSQIKTHCICNGHYNPDSIMFVCDNKKCKIWFHPECLIDYVLKKTHKNLEEITKSKTTLQPAESASVVSAYFDDVRSKPDTRNMVSIVGKEVTKRKSPKKLSEKKDCEYFFKAIIKEDKKRPEFEITDLRKDSDGIKTWSEPIICPKCGTPLE
ncbi:hypothetical protein F5884DRAFT_540720 [Xylogone sp. PMI_703]|nr:hypothetical protein F5884DRAFT_535466 [Xylogone sp. PMI_703]KAH8800847.1 hypothetical protein F5884DRAFT_540720 [Xylogone sp. PMI_703]